MATERVQKILAQAGISSRRKAEEMISEGLVTINGKVAQLGDKADISKDSIKVKGKLLRGTEPPVYFAFYKPRGVISMLEDPEGRPTISDFLPKNRTRVFPIGRLDFNSEGLILLTNDGELAERIQKNDQIARVYHIKIKGHPTPEMLKRLGKGGKVEDRMVRLHSVRIASELANKSIIEIVALGSGGSDHKSLLESKGFLVEKVTRMALGQITLHGLKPGMLRILEKPQLVALVEHPELGMRLIEEAAEKGQAGEEARANRRAKEEFKQELEEKRERVKARTEIDAEDEDGARPARRTTVRAGAISRKPVPPPREDGEERGTEARGGRSERGAKPFGRPGAGRGGERAPKSFARDAERAPKSFARDAERGGKPASRGAERGPKKFGRDAERGPKPFTRDSGRAPKTFSRDPDRAPRSFGRDSERGPKPAGARFERGERGPKPFSRDDREGGFAARNPRENRPHNGPGLGAKRSSSPAPRFDRDSTPAARGGRRSMNDDERTTPSKGVQPRFGGTVEPDGRSAKRPSSRPSAKPDFEQGPGKGPRGRKFKNVF